MAMQLRYAGEFLAVDGTVWRCEILQEAASAFASVGELVLSTTGTPLTIEWPSHELEEPVCGSMATLILNSPGDRTYDDLYTVEPGQIRLDVYRAGVLYWSGSLDPETYEEPYDSGSDYDVTLTFADFGILDRIPYDLSGKKTLLELVTAALGRSGINYGSINAAMISSTFTNGTALTLASLSLPSENFFDEDGVASSWREVLDGILQPLALRMIQRAGVVYVYDLNGIFTSGTVRELEWDGIGSNYGTPPVYNNIKVTFSPYSKSKLTPDFEYGDAAGPEYEPNRTVNPVTPDRYSWYVDYDESHKHGASWDYNLIGFTIFRSRDLTKNKGLAGIGDSNYFFKIVPMSGGNESEGVAVGFLANVHFSMDDVTMPIPVKGINPATHPRTVALRTIRAWLPPVSEAERKNSFIRILMEILADPRYNPFEEAPEDGAGNENANYAEYQSWAQQAFVPVDIVLYDGSGTALYHYTNRNITEKGHPADSVANCSATKRTVSGHDVDLDGWVAGEAAYGDAFLAYYDKELDIVEGCGVLGWKANRQNFGKPWTEGRIASKRDKYYRDENNTRQDWWSFDSYKKAPDGQFIPYPPAGGYLEVRVYNGVYIFDDTDQFTLDDTSTSPSGFASQQLYQKLRWLLYKAPEVSVVRRGLTFEEEEIDDIEYSGVANASAKEDLEIDTICGTASRLCPTARGIYLRSSDGQQVRELTRAGRTDHPEQLLIGTLYSQYAERKVSLSGEIRIDPAGLALYSDSNQPMGRKFLLKSERQDIRKDSAEIAVVEIRPDEYIGVEA
jgi:hypothetical protein